MNARVLGGRLRVSANMIAMSVLGGASSGKTRTNSLIGTYDPPCSAAAALCRCLQALRGKQHPYCFLQINPAPQRLNRRKDRLCTMRFACCFRQSEGNFDARVPQNGLVAWHPAHMAPRSGNIGCGLFRSGCCRCRTSSTLIAVTRSPSRSIG